MITKRIAIASALAAFTVLTTAGAAFAEAGIAKSVVNVRSGPGTGYAKVDSLYAGEAVNVLACNTSWCKIEHDGPDGYVAKSYLKPAAATPSSPKKDIPFNLGLTFGPGGPAISFGIGDAPLPAPIPVPAASKACFFKGPNFTGASFCVPASSHDNHIGFSWNDKISSIKLYGGAQVQICRGYNYTAGCAVVHTSKPSLGSFDDDTSSYQAW
ncbi:SH3 domain-containing protein [Devosia sp.]|uniref:SH3 domain-containing protein n=1 Tax=Devosia sp. TaxID=1871048 RepID=UPI0032675D30